MNDSIQAGLFALAGTLLGGLIAYATARIGHRWDQAQKEIRRLANQVSAYYQLEQLYKDEVARHDPAGRSPKTILEEMRSNVERLGSYERPSITTLQANKILKEWS